MDAVDPYITGLTIRFWLTSFDNIDFSGLSFGKYLPVFFIARCSGLIEPNTLISDNIYQLLRCRNGTKTNEQAAF